MNESPKNEPVDHEAAIDRLASGELDVAGRRGLFEWLDHEPRRWRRCALALLEARELEQALDDWSSEIVRVAPPVHRMDTACHGDGVTSGGKNFVQPSEAAGSVSRRLKPSAALALAASLLVAFGLGIGARGLWPAPAAVVADHASKESQSGKPPPTSEVAEATLPAATETEPWAIAPLAPQRDADGPISPYVRSQLERRGYEVESHHAVLPVKLPDGRRVMLPVDQYQLRYVGQRTS